MDKQIIAFFYRHTGTPHNHGNPVGVTGKTGIKLRRGDRKTPQHKKSHPSASCIAKFPNFTASKPSATISKFQKYEKNQTIPVSHDHLFYRVM